MLRTSVAMLIATTVPALAADKVVSSHEVRFQDQAFICGEVNDRGKIRRFHSLDSSGQIHS